MPSPRKGRGDKAKTQEALLALVLERRSKGEAVPAIAASLGLGSKAVSSLLSRALVERASLADAELAQLRQLELDRVDRWAVVQERRHAQHGDPKSAEMLLRLQARRLALHGVRLDLAEPEAGRGGRASLSQGEGEAGSFPPFLRAMLAQAAAIGGAVGAGAALAQGSSRLALPQGEGEPTQAEAGSIVVTAEPAQPTQAEPAATQGESQAPAESEPASPPCHPPRIPSDAQGESLDPGAGELGR